MSLDPINNAAVIGGNKKESYRKLCIVIDKLRLLVARRAESFPIFVGPAQGMSAVFVVVLV